MDDDSALLCRMVEICRASQQKAEEIRNLLKHLEICSAPTQIDRLASTLHELNTLTEFPIHETADGSTMALKQAHTFMDIFQKAPLLRHSLKLGVTCAVKVLDMLYGSLPDFSDTMANLDAESDVVFERMYEADMELKEFEDMMWQQWREKRLAAEHWRMRRSALLGLRTALRSAWEAHKQNQQTEQDTSGHGVEDTIASVVSASSSQDDVQSHVSQSDGASTTLASATTAASATIGANDIAYSWEGVFPQDQQVTDAWTDEYWFTGGQLEAPPTELYMSGASTSSRTRSSHAQGRKLFVGGLPQMVTTESLRWHFNQFGAVEDAVVMTQHDGKPRGFGFVTFKDRQSTVYALDFNHQLLGRPIDVKAAVSARELPAPPRKRNQKTSTV